MSIEADYSNETDERDPGRVPPHDMSAERSVLGGMMLSKDAIADVVEILKGVDFYRPAHEMVFDAILDLFSRSEPADAITVAAELERRGELGRVGGPPFLHDLTSSVPTAANAGFYAEIVSELAVRRRLVSAGTKITSIGYTGGRDVVELVNEAQSHIYAVSDGNTSEDYVGLGEVVQDTIDKLEDASRQGPGMTGVPTGFSELDELTNGLQPGQMIVIAARPAMGKSTLGLDIVRSCALRHQKAAVIFSLEMGAEELSHRLLSAETQIPLQNFRRSKEMQEDDWGRLARAVIDMESCKLFLDDSPNMSLMEIRAKCRRLKQQEDLSLVVIDYLQLMTSGKRVESRQQEVSEFSRALKLLAKEIEVPVIAISQLNRGPEQRTDKRPMVSDLRESGSIEQDADMVILLHREDAYDKESPRAGEADLIVAKHRNGPTATITVAFQGHYSRFIDMAPAM